jgi:hypothetical protein
MIWTRRRLVRTGACGLSALFLGISTTGCGAEAPWVPITGAVADLAGTYTLASVDGAPLPVDVGSGPTAFSILYSSLTLGSDGTWTETRKELAPDARTIRVSGVWSQDGLAVTLAASSGERYSGSATNLGLRLADGTRGYVFNR